MTCLYASCTNASLRILEGLSKDLKPWPGIIRVQFTVVVGTLWTGL